MKANEFRVGNLVLNDGVINVINMIGYDSVSLLTRQGNSITAHLDLIKPIPLTEEILIKAGFENCGTVICNDYEQFHRFVLHNAIDGSSNFEVHIINSMYGGDYVREFCYSIDDNRQHINCTDYLHNLQNAFYQSSGTELKIEL